VLDAALALSFIQIRFYILMKVLVNVKSMIRLNVIT